VGDGQLVTETQVDSQALVNERTAQPRPGPSARVRERAIRWHRLPISLRIGLSMLALLMAASLLGLVVGEDPTQQNLADVNAPPGSPGYSLGSDPLGRNVLAWTLGGIRTAVLVSAGVVLLSGLIGVSIGLVTGYFGRAVDAILMRLADLMLAVPPILLFLAASAVITINTVSLILLFTVAAWVPYARTVRASVLAERSRAHVSAARLAGSGHVRIMAIHLLPSAITAVLVVGSLQFGYVMLWESGLSFLGLGLQPPTTSLGFMISQGRDTMTTTWWLVVVPGVALSLLVIAMNMIGDGLRDLFDVETSSTEGR
jgi:peptide/nickel transport system permease protein